MAKNMIFKYTENKTRVRVLPAITVDGSPLLDPSDGRPAVALTGTGTQNDRTITTTSADNTPLGGGVKSVTYNEAGGASLVGLEATLAYDGTWAFAVTGAGTNPAQGTQVYIASNGTLSTTASGNTAYGRVDIPTDYKVVAGKVPVRIGA